MPIPRYEGGATPFQQVDPTAAKASAQMFSTLSQRLDSWGDTLYEQGKVQVAQAGQQKAIEDMVSGDPLRTEKGYSFYAKAYNDVSKAAYNIQVESDLKKFAEEAQAKDPLNHEKFGEVFDAYAKASTAKIEDPNFKAIYMQQAWKIGATAKNAMVKASYENAKKNNLEVINTALAEESKAYYAAYAGGDIEGATGSLAKYHTYLDNKVAAGEMDARMIPFEMQKLQKGALANKAMLELDNSIIAGESDYINKFMQSKEYKSLTVDERHDITKKMHEQVDTAYKALQGEANGNDKFLEAASKKTTTEIMKKVYSGQDVSDQTLKDMVTEGKLSHTAYKAIGQDIADLKGGATVDDSQTVTNYELHIESASPQSIARDSRLTAKTKQRLISKVINHKETVRGNDALASGFKNQRLTMGKTSWQMATEYLGANIFDDDPDKEKQKRNNILNVVRDEVKSGKVDPLQAHERTIELADQYVQKNKDSLDSTKYDRSVKKYNAEVTEYRRNTQGNFNKIWNSLGKPLPAPVAPAKPANYIPKDRRN